MLLYDGPVVWLLILGTNWRLSVKVGDLVVQLGWEADGVGVVTRILRTTSLDQRATVQWPNGEVNMYQSQLRVISESR